MFFWLGLKNYVVSSNTDANKATTFAIPYRKLNLPCVTLSIDNNSKLLQQLKSGFKCTIYRNKCQPRARIQERNQHLDYLLDPSFHGENRVFSLSFEKNAFRILQKRYFIPTTEMQNYKSVIDGGNFLIS